MVGSLGWIVREKTFAKLVPLRYQVNDPAASLPWCFPHFPRMDWSLWFVPLGDPGRWLAQLLRGLLSGDPAILSLVDERAFRAAFRWDTHAGCGAHHTFFREGSGFGYRFG